MRARRRIRLYGGLDLEATVPPDWHRHPLTGHGYAPDAHWTTFKDADPGAGDIKDLWELSRFGWLHARLRSWAATGDEDEAEIIWRVVEDWWVANPPYLGAHWMCGQETSLRTIGVMFLADALDTSASTTDDRRAMVASLVQDAVGRVAPTLGYALSQRNNHAISEAGFLWSAVVLAPWLPHAGRLRRRAQRALTEAVADQVASDGSYAQHSPTYQRVALHVLLWCLAVERATGAAAPSGVSAAVARSVGHLGPLIAPGSEGCVPDLGGDDGALVFALAPAAIGDMRPALAHAAAATAVTSDLGSGVWDEEAAWFGLAPTSGADAPVSPSRTTHALTRGRAHAVVRAGPLAHRPAHADQLHVDVWLNGLVVARDPGSYRYTAVPPWGNALAGEDVHNVPRRRGHPQAIRSGRFFWRQWSEAIVETRTHQGPVTALVARLDLGGVVVRRLIAVVDGFVLVADQADGASLTVRWNLPDAVVPHTTQGCTVVQAPSWRAELRHGAEARVLTPDPGDPASGWWAPGYGRREPHVALEVETDGAGTAVAAFAVVDTHIDVSGVVAAAAALDLTGIDLDDLAERLALTR